MLAEIIHVKRFDYAVAYFTEWYNNNFQLFSDCNVNILDMLYWEERIANWGTQIQLEKDIAQEDIIPYNSRLLVEILLGVPKTDNI